MSLNKLLTDKELEFFKNEYHNFLLNKRNTKNTNSLENFFTIIRKKNIEFNKFSNRQLINQIIYCRNKFGHENWPNIDDYSSYITLTARNYIKKSINSCLLAVEIYNKPLVSFRTENYIVLMMISWTSILHALFHENNIKYKNSDNDYYDLSKCVEIYTSQSFAFERELISENINFLYELRNEITHRSSSPIDEDVFGECQACLYNFQDFLFHYWGEEFQLGISLAHSLQFSRSIRESKLKALSKHEITKLNDINSFIGEYRSKLKKINPDIYNNPRFSFKVFMIPKLASKDKNADIAVEFIKLSDMAVQRQLKLSLNDNYNSHKTLPLKPKLTL